MHVLQPLWFTVLFFVVVLARVWKSPLDWFGKAFDIYLFGSWWFGKATWDFEKVSLGLEKLR